MRTRAWLLAALAAVSLAACDRKTEPAAPAREAAAPAVAATPLTFERKTADAEVSLTLPDALRAHPGLHKRLYDREVTALTAFADDAVAERRALGMEMPPYGSEVTWRVAAETDRLLSLVREASSYSGGAHPNSATEALLWDKTAGREVSKDALLPLAAREPLEAQLCQGLTQEKAKRGAAAPDSEVWPCPKLSDVAVALAPGSRGGAGGLTALIDPYVAGPYAEGGYEITLPAALATAAVAPAYRDQFAG